MTKTTIKNELKKDVMELHEAVIKNVCKGTILLLAACIAVTNNWAMFYIGVCLVSYLLNKYTPEYEEEIIIELIEEA